MAAHSREVESDAIGAVLQALDPLTRQHSGLDLRQLDERLVKKAVDDHMAENGARGLGDYLGILRDPTQIARLTEKLVVGETWFFRDDGAYRFLGQIAVEKRARDGVLRVLSLPCSSGEEAYSIAMRLLDSGLSVDRFHIVGADISARAIKQATDGHFSANSFRSSNLGFRDRYFTPDGDGFAIDPVIRDAVRFTCGNILDADWAQQQGTFDVVFCRNLIIYFKKDARERLLRNIERFLAPDGVLFVGAAEAGLFLGSDYTPAGDASSFAFYRIEEPAALRQRKAAPSARARPKRRKRTKDAPTVLVKDGGNLLPSSELPSVTYTPADESDVQADSLERAELHANRGELDQATRLISAALDEDGGNARAFFLLGVVRLVEGEEDEAEGLFDKALYLDPDYRDAIHHLSALAEHRGDHKRMLALDERARKLDSGIESSSQA